VKAKDQVDAASVEADLVKEASAASRRLGPRWIEPFYRRRTKLDEEIS
jgi:hypothetical protein